MLGITLPQPNVTIGQHSQSLANVVESNREMWVSYSELTVLVTATAAPSGE